ncbi:MAG: ABC transporter ATP-binding protein [Bacteroidia bacterium]
MMPKPSAKKPQAKPSRLNPSKPTSKVSSPPSTPSPDKDTFLWLLRLFARQKQSLIALFLTLALSLLGPLRPYLYRHIIDEIQKPQILIFYASLLGVISIAFALFHHFQLRLSNRIALELILFLRRKLFHRTLHLTTSYLDKTPSGWLYTRLISDIQNLQTTFSETFLTMGSETLQILFLVILMYLTDPWLTLLTLATLPASWIMMRFFQKRIHKAFDKIRSFAAQLNAFIQESYVGRETLATLQAYPQAEKIFHRLNHAYYQGFRQTITYFSIFFPALEIFTTATLILILAYGSWQITHQTSTPGTLIAFVFYLQLFFRPLRLLSDQLNTLQLGLVSAKRIRHILESAPQEKRLPPQKSLPRGPYAIRLENLTFGYKPKKTIFENLNFEFEAGKFYVLSAPTGTGKTTLFSLLVRYYLPQKGEIYLADIPLSQWNLDQLRSQIVYIPQDPVLLRGSLYENLTFYQAMPEKKLWTAAEKLGIARWAKELALQHPLQEGGHNLSAGEKQLLALWRLYLRQPAVLLLDEVTAHIDPYTEKFLQQALSAFRGKTTILAIAHRSYTLEISDINLLLTPYALRPFSHHPHLQRKTEY